MIQYIYIFGLAEANEKDVRHVGYEEHSPSPRGSRCVRFFTGLIIAHSVYVRMTSTMLLVRNAFCNSGSILIEEGSTCSA
jgi:hypothetical protein